MLTFENQNAAVKLNVQVVDRTTETRVQNDHVCAARRCVVRLFILWFIGCSFTIFLMLTFQSVSHSVLLLLKVLAGCVQTPVQFGSNISELS